MSYPKYKIHGQERRSLKKQLHELKILKHYFWFYHELDNDMTTFLGNSDEFVLDTENAQKKYDELTNQINEIEKKLSEPFSNEPSINQYSEHIFTTLKRLESNELNVVETHQILVQSHLNFMRKLVSEFLTEQQEVISSPIRFNGVSVSNVKNIFEKHGFRYEPEF